MSLLLSLKSPWGASLSLDESTSFSQVVSDPLEELESLDVSESLEESDPLLDDEAVDVSSSELDSVSDSSLPSSSSPSSSLPSSSLLLMIEMKIVHVIGR